MDLVQFKNNMGLKEKLDFIDSEIIGEVFDGFKESRKRILIGMWEKGKTITEYIVSFTGVKKTPPSFRQLEKETGRSDSALKKWHDLYNKYPDQIQYEAIAEIKAVEWTERALRKKDLPKPLLSDLVLPSGIYNVIYTDPPWQYSNDNFVGSAESKYPTQSTDDLCLMPIQELTAKNCVLFMWSTNPLLEDAIQLLNAWGFEYKTNMVWIKDKSTYGGLGFYVYGQHELLLIATKGSMLPEGECPKSVIESETREHSQKPEIFYSIIESMYPGAKYLEIFARNKRQGWDSIGNEVNKYE